MGNMQKFAKEQVSALWWEWPPPLPELVMETLLFCAVLPNVCFGQLYFIVPAKLTTMKSQASSKKIKEKGDEPSWEI